MSEKSPFKYESANSSPGFLLWKLTGLWQSELNRILSAFGLTQTQYAILASLRWLSRDGEIPTQMGLVTHSKIEKMTLSKSVRRLEQNGLLSRSHNMTDKRLIDVILTPEGQNLISKAIVVVEEADESFFQVLSESDLALYKKLMVDIIHKNE